MLLEPEERERITLGVIPNGVLNDFAHFWGFDESHLEQTIVWLKQKRVRRVDVGCIHYENKKNERCRRYFLNCVNIGMVANIMSLSSPFAPPFLYPAQSPSSSLASY